MNQKNRRRKFGALSMVITVLGIVLIIAANLVAAQLTEKYGWSKDLTANGRYAISEDSVQYLETVEEEVKITVFVSEEEMSSGSCYIVQAYQNLLQYEKNSDKVELEFVDLIENPTYVAKYPELELSAYDILVESGEKQEVLSFQNLYEYDTTSGAVTASKVEQMMTSAVIKVTSEEKAGVVVLGGYSKVQPTELTELLVSNGYEVSQQSLLTDEIDPKAQTVILFAPQSDLEENSLTKLGTWLENDGNQGKNLFVFIDPAVPALPNLEAFLKEWGIVLGEGFAFEADNNFYYDKFIYPVAQYSDMEYAEGMTSSDLTIMALCRPVDVLFAGKDNYETSILLNFSPASGVVTLDQTEITADQITGDVKGMVISSHSWYGTEVTKSNVVVSGSSLAFSGSLMTGSTFANADYILGVFQKLSGESSALNIVPKDLSAPTHTMTMARANAYIWIFMIILPILILAAGVVVWMRRKNR